MALSKQAVSGFGLIIIGSEILDGRIRDRHFDACRDLLESHRLPLIYTLILKDAPALITDQLRWAMAQEFPFFSSGGIGGTPDDHTRGCVANALGVPVETHPEGLAILQERLAGEAVRESVLRMVQFPAGSELIPNPINRIPGFSIGNGHFVPGFPEMAQPMMEWVLKTKYTIGEKTIRHSMILPGAREADLTHILDALTDAYRALAISSLPRMNDSGGEVELSIQGAPDQVAQAYGKLRHEIDALGMTYREM
ncbi:MAG: molybdopterin-binding protein [Verrucomicrobia bacterium]|nr:molybdopterin-binding protein [Verrucomicrobiota bacterium]